MWGLRCSTLKDGHSRKRALPNNNGPCLPATSKAFRDTSDKKEGTAVRLLLLLLYIEFLLSRQYRAKVLLFIKNFFFLFFLFFFIFSLPFFTATGHVKRNLEKNCLIFQNFQCTLFFCH